MVGAVNDKQNLLFLNYVRMSILLQNIALPALFLSFRIVNSYSFEWNHAVRKYEYTAVLCW